VSLVTIATYTAITGDWDCEAAAASARLEEAVELLEDALDRKLEHGTHTELLRPDRDGYLWPRVVPITAATGYTIDGDGIYGTIGPVFGDITGRVSATYSGGFVERTANPNATNALPKYIERDICFAALALKQVDPDRDGNVIVAATYPAGATSVRLGDAAVTFGPGGPPRPEDAVQWSRRTLRWRHNNVRGAG
jgi:hypothetical protein